MGSAPRRFLWLTERGFYASGNKGARSQRANVKETRKDLTWLQGWESSRPKASWIRMPAAPKQGSGKLGSGPAVGRVALRKESGAMASAGDLELPW